MTFVIDASVAIQWVVEEEGSDRAAQLIAAPLLAPSYWLAEAAQVLWKRVRRGEFDAPQATRRLDSLLAAPVQAVEIAPHMPAALELAMRLKHPVYDCMYLALAFATGAPVVTADRKFYMAVQSEPALSRHIRLL